MGDSDKGKQPDGPWNVLKLINWTKAYFEKNGVDSPRLATEMLLAHVLQCPRIALYTRFDLVPQEQQLADFRALVKRAVAHEPVAYLVGEREFYSLRFKVTPDVLIPRPESEILVTEALDYLATLPRSGRVWDACTGSGCVAIAIAHQNPQAQVLATDICPKAIAVAQQNAELNGVADRVRCMVADLLHLPLEAADMAPFDIITANPPYVRTHDPVAEEVAHEPHIALYGGSDGLKFLRPIIETAPDLLLPGGILALEFGFEQADDVRDLITDGDDFDEPRILLDRQQLERTAVAVRF